MMNFIFIISVFFLKTHCNVVINEINVASSTTPQINEFVELHYFDPCLFARYSIDGHGPMLDEYYLAYVKPDFDLVLQTKKIQWTLTIIANMTNYFFKGNNSLFTIGSKFLKPDFVIVDKTNHFDLLPNGDIFPVAILLIKANAVETAPWTNKERIPMNNQELHKLERVTIDMVVYANRAPFSSCKPFEKIHDGFEQMPYLLRELDLPYDQVSNSIPEDLSLARCGNLHEIARPFNPKAFHLTKPTPGDLNLCEGPHINFDIRRRKRWSKIKNAIRNAFIPLLPDDQKSVHGPSITLNQKGEGVIYWITTNMIGKRIGEHNTVYKQVRPTWLEYNVSRSYDYYRSRLLISLNFEMKTLYGIQLTQTFTEVMENMIDIILEVHLGTANRTDTIFLPSREESALHGDIERVSQRYMEKLLKHILSPDTQEDEFVQTTTTNVPVAQIGTSVVPYYGDEIEHQSISTQSSTWNLFLHLSSSTTDNPLSMTQGLKHTAISHSLLDNQDLQCEFHDFNEIELHEYRNNQYNQQKMRTQKLCADKHPNQRYWNLPDTCHTLGEMKAMSDKVFNEKGAAIMKKFLRDATSYKPASMLKSADQCRWVATPSKINVDDKSESAAATAIVSTIIGWGLGVGTGVAGVSGSAVAAGGGAVGAGAAGAGAGGAAAASGAIGNTGISTGTDTLSDFLDEAIDKGTQTDEIDDLGSDNDLGGNDENESHDEKNSEEDNIDDRDTDKLTTPSVTLTSRYSKKTTTRATRPTTTTTTTTTVMTTDMEQTTALATSEVAITEMTTHEATTHVENVYWPSGDIDCFLNHTKEIPLNPERSACGTGDLSQLQQLSDLTMDVQALEKKYPIEILFAQGIANEADLLLSRGAGIFLNMDLADSQEILLKTYVCEKHRQEYGLKWYRQNRKKITTKRKTEKCMIGRINGLQPFHTSSVEGRHRITREHARALVTTKDVLLPIGYPLCTVHNGLLIDLIIDMRTREKGYNFRPHVLLNFAETPKLPQGELSETCEQDISTESHCSWRSVSGIKPPVGSPPQKRPRTDDVIAEQEIMLRHFAKCLNVEGIHITDHFRELTFKSKKERASSARQLMYIIFGLMASDDVDHLAELTLKSTITQLWNADLTDKWHDLLQQTADNFDEADSNSARYQTLSSIVNFVSYSQMQSYIPGLSYSMWKRAKSWAITVGPGLLPNPKDETNGRGTMRLDQSKVVTFLEFLTSEFMLNDVPWGHTVMKTTTGKTNIEARVRTMRQERIVKQYYKYLKEMGTYEDLKMSRSSLIQIIRWCPAKTSKALAGLDYITQDGKDGFSSLIQLTRDLGRMGLDKKWEQDTVKGFREMDQYIRSDYKLHLKRESRISDHCMQHSLNDPKNLRLRTPGNHDHKYFCINCERLKHLLTELKEKVASAPWPNPLTQQQALWRCGNAITAVEKWKAHQLRTRFLDDARKSMLLDLTEEEIFIVMDWAMKYLPKKFRETQSDWFAKKGVPWHICVIYMKRNSVMYKRTVVHVFDQNSQASSDVTAILEHVLRVVLYEVPTIKSATVRSDNAGAYHSQE